MPSPNASAVRRRRRRASRRNPTGATWVLGTLLGTVVAAGGAWLWWSSRKKRDYVGSGWDWPRRSIFPTELSFGAALAELGYGAAYGLPDWEILSAETIETVRAFQRDFNEVRRALGIGSIVGELDDDGLIGEETIRAMEFALDHTRDEGDSWILLVRDARLHNAGVKPY
jgi:hypothetical protein